jgi:glycine oxidase
VRVEMARPDVLIVGGGVIGAATAFYLADLGVDVTLLERRHAGGHASVAAAAILHPIDEPDSTAPYRQFSRLSMAMFPGLVASIQELTGISASFEQAGWIRVASTGAEVEELRTRLSMAQGFGLEARWLDSAALREMEPALAVSDQAALFHPAGAQLYAPAYLQGLLQGAARRGAKIRTGIEVATLETDRQMVTGARLAGGESIAAGHTIVASGAWSAILLERIGIRIPIHPMRGQILSLYAVPPPIRHVVLGSDIMLAPKVDGSIVVGATYENAGFDDRLTADGVGGLLSGATLLAPVLGGATFRCAWVGLRPCTADDMPILGAIGSWTGLTIAAGHGREGILHSPITGKLIAQLVTGAALDMPLESFGLRRFDTA